jgi:hypothetical protein
MQEMKDTHVGVHMLSPGMMLTDLLLKVSAGLACSHGDRSWVHAHSVRQPIAQGLLLLLASVMTGRE